MTSVQHALEIADAHFSEVLAHTSFRVTEGSVVKWRGGPPAAVLTAEHREQIATHREQITAEITAWCIDHADLLAPDEWLESPTPLGQALARSAWRSGLTPNFLGGWISKDESTRHPLHAAARDFGIHTLTIDGDRVDVLRPRPGLRFVTTAPAPVRVIAHDELTPERTSGLPDAVRARIRDGRYVMHDIAAVLGVAPGQVAVLPPLTEWSTDPHMVIAEGDDLIVAAFEPDVPGSLHGMIDGLRAVLAGIRGLIGIVDFGPLTLDRPVTLAQLEAMTGAELRVIARPVA